MFFKQKFTSILNRQKTFEDFDVIDRFHLVKITFSLLGLLSYLNWNVILSTSNTWLFKLRNVNKTFIPSYTSKSELYLTFINKLSMLITIPSLITMILIVLFGHKTKSFIRILIPLLVMINVYTVIAILIKLDTDHWQLEFFYILISLIVIMAVANSILFASITALVISFPRNIIGWMLAGQPVPGILCILCQMYFKSYDTEPRVIGIKYCVLSSTLFTITLASFLIARNTKYFKFYNNIYKGHILDNSSFGFASHFSDLKSIFFSLLFYILSIFFIFFISSSVYPSLVLFGEPVNSKEKTWFEYWFTSVYGILGFNLGDFIGRLTSKTFKIKQIKSYYIFLLSVFRVLIAIGIIFCNLYPRKYLNVLFFSDYYFATFVLALGFSQGFLITMTITKASKRINSRLRQKAGFVFSLVFSVAITFATVLSNFLINHI